MRSAEVEMPSSSSVMEISMGGSNRTGGDFSTEPRRRCECEVEGDMMERELVEG